MQTMSLPPSINNVHELLHDFDNFLLDLWGVIHDGVSLFPHAQNALALLKQHNKCVVFISNAPRRASVIKAQLHDFGINHDSYDALFSSGEVTWQTLKKEGIQKYGATCYHIGPPRDHHLLEGLPFEVTTNINNADFILNSGPWRDNDALTNYAPMLAQSAHMNIPMLCANPDKEVVRGGKKMICAGALAQHYETLGGTVTYFGKPHKRIYDTVFEFLNTYPTAGTKSVAIGDSLATDIKGAKNAGIHTILVTSGIHKNAKSESELKNLFQEHNAQPDALMTHFQI